MMISFILISLLYENFYLFSWLYATLRIQVLQIFLISAGMDTFIVGFLIILISL